MMKFPICGKINNVPNHQPDKITIRTIRTIRSIRTIRTISVGKVEIPK
jgi:hypothetical protein